MQVYRQTTIGERLVEAVEELKDQNKLTEDLALKVMDQFDLSFLKAFKEKISAKASIKAKLTTYNYFDNVWQFQLEDIEFRLNPSGTGSVAVYQPVVVDKAKIVCVDAKLMQEEHFD